MDPALRAKAATDGLDLFDRRTVTSVRGRLGILKDLTPQGRRRTAEPRGILDRNADRQAALWDRVTSMSDGQTIPGGLHGAPASPPARLLWRGRAWARLTFGAG